MYPPREIPIFFLGSTLKFPFFPSCGTSLRLLMSTMIRSNLCRWVGSSLRVTLKSSTGIPTDATAFPLADEWMTCLNYSIVRCTRNITFKGHSPRSRTMSWLSIGDMVFMRMWNQDQSLADEFNVHIQIIGIFLMNYELKVWPQLGRLPKFLFSSLRMWAQEKLCIDSCRSLPRLMLKKNVGYTAFRGT